MTFVTGKIVGDSTMASYNLVITASLLMNKKIHSKFLIKISPDYIFNNFRML
ncbi:hypothetical protein D1BOALGB6SA_3059 [Olavius sp. associated proteobacterium Delta 1]|nr:hypothetical protein D1BOALGB6SA_3059 [Olavius sp. associated proteobacterium Delta 1]